MAQFSIVAFQKDLALALELGREEKARFLHFKTSLLLEYVFNRSLKNLCVFKCFAGAAFLICGVSFVRRR